MSSWRIGFVLGTTEGGTGRHAAMLASACAAAGAEVKVFAPESARAFFAASGSGSGSGSGSFVPVALADRPRPVADLAARRLLRRLMSGFRPDVVHAHGLRAGALTALTLPARVPLIVTVHNAPPAGARLAAIYAVLERIVARRASVVLCVSCDLAARMRARGARSVQRALVPAPVRAPGESADGPKAAELADLADLAALGRPIVLGVGRLAGQKGFDVLLEAADAAGWLARTPAPLVVIAGGGPLAADLAARADSLGVDARFLGVRSDVAELLAVADVFVLPSRWEGQPLILQEALRAGRPIVATDVGGVRDVCGDAAALLVPPADPAALGAAILTVLDNPDVRDRLTAAATARAAALPTEAEATAAALALYHQAAPPDPAPPDPAPPDPAPPDPAPPDPAPPGAAPR